MIRRSNKRRPWFISLYAMLPPGFLAARLENPLREFGAAWRAFGHDATAIESALIRMGRAFRDGLEGRRLEGDVDTEELGLVDPDEGYHCGRVRCGRPRQEKGPCGCVCWPCAIVNVTQPPQATGSPPPGRRPGAGRGDPS